VSNYRLGHACQLIGEWVSAFGEDDIAPAVAVGEVAADAFADADGVQSGGVAHGRAGCFSARMPDWMVQIPAVSVESIRASRRAWSMPRLST
jgi:hypothetical protein